MVLSGDLEILDKEPTMLVVMSLHWYPLAMKDWGAAMGQRLAKGTTH